MAATVLVFSCKKANDPKKPATDPSKDAPETTSDDPAKPEDKAKPVAITIDGQFSDWDAITEETAKDNKYIDVVKAGDADPIRIVKASSDDEFIYFYAEVAWAAMPQNWTCTEGGDSYNGTPENGWANGNHSDEEDSFGETFNVFFDPDGNDKTGFLTWAGIGEDADPDEPEIPGLGCEMCSQFFMCYNPHTEKLVYAWEQTNIGPTKIGTPYADGEGDTMLVNADGYTGDYDYNGTMFQSWPTSGEEAAFPLYGWQYIGDGKVLGDNVAPKYENFDQALDGDYVRVEFAFEISELVNKPDDATEYAWGISFRFDDNAQGIGPVRAAYAE